MPPHNTETQHRNIFVTVCFWICIVFLYLPIVCLIAQGFLRNPYEWTSGFTFGWLLKLFRSSTFWEPLQTSLEIALLSATLSVALGTMGATGLFQRAQSLTLNFRTLIMLPILLPEVITGLSLLLFFRVLKLELGFWTVVVAHASFSASFVYFIMVEQLRKLDPQMEEAARDLGANEAQVFWRVTFPNILPGLFGGWLLAFTLSFDDFLISFFTSGAGLTTLPLKIYSLMRIGVSPELNGLVFVMFSLSTLLVLTLVSREQSRKWVLRG